MWMCALGKLKNWSALFRVPKPTPGKQSVSDLHSCTSCQCCHVWRQELVKQREQVRHPSLVGGVRGCALASHQKTNRGQVLVQTLQVHTNHHPIICKSHTQWSVPKSHQKTRTRSFVAKRERSICDGLRWMSFGFYLAARYGVRDIAELLAS